MIADELPLRSAAVLRWIEGDHRGAVCQLNTDAATFLNGDHREAEVLREAVRYFKDLCAVDPRAAARFHAAECFWARDAARGCPELEHVHAISGLVTEAREMREIAAGLRDMPPPFPGEGP